VDRSEMETFVREELARCTEASQLRIQSESAQRAHEVGHVKNSLEGTSVNLSKMLRRLENTEAACDMASTAFGQIANRAEVRDLVNEKASEASLDLEALESRLLTQLQEHVKHQKLDVALECKAGVGDISQLDHRMEDLKRGLENMQQCELQLSKLSRRHEEAIDLSATIEQVDKVVREVQCQINTKADALNLADFVKEQTFVNQNIFHEFVVGRWIWNSHHTKPGNLVPWNIEAINTQPGAFQWKTDSTKIVAVQAGLYEISYGFFTRTRPSIQLLLNGEPCLIASHNTHQTSARASGVKHKSGNVTGHTLVEFLALPARGKLSFTFNGEGPTEGFMALRKL